MSLRNTVQPNGTPTWVALDVPDLARAQTFYTGLFDWKIDRTAADADEFLLIRKDRHIVAGLQKARISVASAWIPYLATDNIDATTRAITGNGGRILALAPNADLLGLARTAIARDPDGVMFGLWEALGLSGMGLWNEANAVMWSEKFSPRLDANKAFFKSVFGNILYAGPIPWHFGDPEKALDGYAMFSTNGQAVGSYGQYAVASIGELDPEDPIAEPHWMTCFATRDIDAAVAKVAALGGAVLRGPYQTMFGPLAIVRDDQGTTFMLGVSPDGA